jgi:hypothetical protein
LFSLAEIAKLHLILKTKTQKPVVYDINEKTTIPTDAYLDPNHTHFILVNDDTENQYGAEINFRAGLEKEISQGYHKSYYVNKQHKESTPIY